MKVSQKSRMRRKRMKNRNLSKHRQNKIPLRLMNLCLKKKRYSNKYPHKSLLQKKDQNLAELHQDKK